MRAIPQIGPTPSHGNGVGNGAPAKSTIIPGGTLDRAVGVLRAAGKPIHIDDIVSAMGAGTVKTNVVSALDRNFHKKGAVRVVDKPKRGIYALVAG